MEFSKDKVIIRLNAIIDEFNSHKDEWGQMQKDMVAVLYWLKYGTDSEDPEIQKIVNIIPFRHGVEQ